MVDLSGFCIGIFDVWFDDVDEVIVIVIRSFVNYFCSVGVMVVFIEILELFVVWSVYLVIIVIEIVVL